MPKAEEVQDAADWLAKNIVDVVAFLKKQVRTEKPKTS